jgi:alpha-tubulin suppressor-like RCC1 family protein
MANVGYTANSTLFEQKYVKFRDVGIPNPYVNGGTLWSCGVNNVGQLGNNTITNISSPVQVGVLTDWSLVSSGKYHALAIKTDGTLWGWGNNGWGGGGQLGLGDQTHRSSPTQVGSLTNWRLVSGGGYHSAAIKTDGTLWSWGNNNYGQLGHNDRTNISSPTQLGSLTNWSAISGGSQFSLAIKTDGTLWSWGYNANGRLGIGDTTHRSTPVQVGALTNWNSINCGTYHTLAIKTDGTLWSWGSFLEGKLGLGILLSDKQSPEQVGALTDWSVVGAGDEHSVAIKTDGTLWSWGKPEDGALGAGLWVDNTRSPVRVGALTNWRLVSSGIYFSIAIKTDGTLWGWGHNTYGSLGTNNTTHRSSPVQISSLTTWELVETRVRHTIALRNYS